MNFIIAKLNEINGFQDVKIKGNFSVTSVSTLINPKNNSVIFMKKFTEENLQKLEGIKEALLLVPVEEKERFKGFEVENQLVYSTNPRRDFAVILNEILSMEKRTARYKTLVNGIVTGENTKIGKNTYIEPGVFMDNDVTIGENCTILSGARIKPNTVIGDNCLIRENCVIGGEGFGIETNEDGTTVRIPHVGGVQRGNNVEIGALTAVAAGTIEPTIIEDYVKIDNLVHVAHNCRIGRGTLITACAEISGSTVIGANSWIAPNASIMNKISIGDNSTVGIGAVVLKSMEANSVVTGNPAQSLDKIKKISKFNKKILNDEV